MREVTATLTGYIVKNDEPGKVARLGVRFESESGEAIWMNLYFSEKAYKITKGKLADLGALDFYIEALKQDPEINHLAAKALVAGVALRHQKGNRYRLTLKPREWNGKTYEDVTKIEMYKEVESLDQKLDFGPESDEYMPFKKDQGGNK